MKDNFLKRIYEKQYKLLLLIPFIMLAIAIGSLITFHMETGSFINKGISLKGGTSITVIDDAITENEVVSNINYDGEFSSRILSSSGKQLGLIIELEETNPDKVDLIVETLKTKFNLNDNDITVETIGSSLGQSFFRETVKAMIFAFIFMGIVVFLYFRTVIPSFAVILAALSDIIITMSIVNYIGIKVGTAGIAAFLMLIGYSVDTDILLSTKVIKRREKSISDRIYSAMSTGLMMSLTTITAVVIALIFSQSPVISQIMEILLIGLLIDLINTWIQNAEILRWYAEKKLK